MSEAISDHERASSVVFDESNPIAAVESLPSTVFPVAIKLELGRTTAIDQAHETLSTPEYPVDVRRPKGPYIPESTVYFDNPAERPPRNSSPWRPSEFCDRIETLLEELESAENVDTDRIYFTQLDVVELAPRHTTTDRETGQSVATPELYQDEGEMTLASFQRDGGLSASRVRDSLDTAMPGESRSPPQLIEIKEVSAKPSRSSRQTQQPAGRHRYYTDPEAERTGKLDATPSVWKLNRVAEPTESHRPLDSVLADIDQFLPALSETDLIQQVEFRGRTQTREQFYAEEVISR